MSDTRLTQMPETYNTDKVVMDTGLVRTVVDKIKATHPGIFDNFNWNDFKFYFIPKERDIYAGLQQAKHETLEDNRQPTDDLELAYNYPDRLAYRVRDKMEGFTGGGLDVPENQYTVNRFSKYVTQRGDYVIVRLRDDVNVRRKYVNPDVIFIFRFNDLPTIDDVLRAVGLSGEYTFEYDYLEPILNRLKSDTFKHQIVETKEQLNDNHIRVTFKASESAFSIESGNPVEWPVLNEGAPIHFLVRNSINDEQKVVFNFVRDAVEKVEIIDDIDDKALNSSIDDVLETMTYIQN